MALPAVHPLQPQPTRVLRVRRETQDTVTLRLDASFRPGGMPFRPGQFLMLYAFGVGEVPISLSGDPGAPQVLEQTVRGVGAVTRAIAGARRGDVLGIRGPYGHPWPLEECEGADLLLIAGGLGLAPLRPVVHQVLRERKRYGQVVLLVGARTPEDLLYRSELARWQARAALDVRVTVDRAPPGWTGKVGVVPALLREVHTRAGHTRAGNIVAFVCGPEVMMRFTVRELERMGVPDSRIHLSMERNMKCAVGHCGHCQYGPTFVCTDGPVVRFEQLRQRFWVREV